MPSAARAARARQVPTRLHGRHLGHVQRELGKCRPGCTGCTSGTCTRSAPRGTCSASSASADRAARVAPRGTCSASSASADQQGRHLGHVRSVGSSGHVQRELGKCQPGCTGGSSGHVHSVGSSGGTCMASRESADRAPRAASWGSSREWADTTPDRALLGLRFSTDHLGSTCPSAVGGL